jgi:hypothetical protein
MSYITKDSTRNEVYEAYIKTQKLLKMERHRMKINQDKVKEVRKEKNKKYNELRYQLLKRDRKIFGMQKHIQNLQRFAIKERHKAKKKGIEVGISRIRVQDYSIKKMYEFLLQIEQVSNILGMKLRFCSFMLWAGRYSFFTSKDYKRDLPNTPHSFHRMVAHFKKHNFIQDVSSKDGVKQYALNGVGIAMFEKIDKFTKKHFEVNE